MHLDSSVSSALNPRGSAWKGSYFDVMGCRNSNDSFGRQINSLGSIYRRSHRGACYVHLLHPLARWPCVGRLSSVVVTNWIVCTWFYQKNPEANCLQLRVPCFVRARCFFLHRRICPNYLHMYFRVPNSACDFEITAWPEKHSLPDTDSTIHRLDEQRQWFCYRYYVFSLHLSAVALWSLHQRSWRCYNLMVAWTWCQSPNFNVYRENHNCLACTFRHH